ncbi:GNAT family N-acetyltransferase [Streptomyces griseorubiginosus]|uniref:GNAT family N-acetyltransferase n=1 Tax=Streptomyces griseorubiginosus TaxID=67304 RepID=UPI003684D871
MITLGLSDRAGRQVVLRDVDDENWRAVADVAPLDEQRRYVAPSAARYLLLSQREGVWHSLAVCADNTVAGHVMWGRDDDGSYWLGGMVIDGPAQGKGVGRAAVLTLVEWLARRSDCAELRLSYHPDNTPAARLYTAVGFRPTGEVSDGEVVAGLRVVDGRPLAG